MISYWTGDITYYTFQSDDNRVGNMADKRVKLQYSCLVNLHICMN